MRNGRRNYGKQKQRAMSLQDAAVFQLVLQLLVLIVLYKLIVAPVKPSKERGQRKEFTSLKKRQFQIQAKLAHH
jgi:hypothetical protein